MKIKYILSLTLFFNCAVAAQKRVICTVICDETLFRSHYIDIKAIDDRETGCTAPLCILEGEVSASFAGNRCTLTVKNPHLETTSLVVSPENITFILKLIITDKGQSYARKSDTVTLAEVYSYLNDKVKPENAADITQRARRAISSFFEGSQCLKECTYSKIEKFQTSPIDVQFLGFSDTWLVFFPKENDSQDTIGIY